MNMDMDYRRGNLDELNDLLYETAKKNNQSLSGDLRYYAGCTTREIKAVVFSVLANNTTLEEREPIFRRAAEMMGLILTEDDLAMYSNIHLAA